MHITQETANSLQARRQWELLFFSMAITLNHKNLVLLSKYCACIALDMFSMNYPDDKVPIIAIKNIEKWLVDPSEENQIACENSSELCLKVQLEDDEVYWDCKEALSIIVSAGRCTVKNAASGFATYCACATQKLDYSSGPKISRFYFYLTKQGEK